MEIFLAVISTFFVQFMAVFLKHNYPKMDKYTQAFWSKLDR
ncbi:hypothetical protein N0824_00213 [Microcystis sp. 0824]|nr:hypothetical protein N0824_00213 [Microcystis sp. 0824]